MDAKEKAYELVQWFFNSTDHMQWYETKMAADKCVEEIVVALVDSGPKYRKYWYDVKVEIHKL